MPFKIFISYPVENVDIARQLHLDLEAAGFETWIDFKNLLPGIQRETAIRQAIHECSHFIALMSSRSLGSKNSSNNELNYALRAWGYFPLGKIFVIPVRLDECKPENLDLADLQSVDLFRSYAKGLGKILQAINAQDFSESTPAYEPAIPAIREAIAVATELLQQGNYRAAVTQLSKAYDRDPLDPRVNLFLGIAKLDGRNPKNCDWALIREVEQALLTAARSQLTRVDALSALALVKIEHYQKNHRKQYPPTVSDILQNLEMEGTPNFDQATLRLIRCSPGSRQLLGLRVNLEQRNR